MKTMKTMQPRSAQQGFTIIELVVVILLLGILTATALPRFLDVTTEAHGAVVDSTQGGLQTGVALFRAQVIGQGRPADGTQIAQFNNLRVNSAGYPGGGNATDGTFDGAVGNEAGANECRSIFVGLLQGGGPVVYASTDSSSAAVTSTDLSTAASNNADFVAKLTAADTCTYAYAADPERRDVTSNDVPALVYFANQAAADASTIAAASAGAVVQTDL